MQGQTNTAQEIWKIGGRNIENSRKQTWECNYSAPQLWPLLSKKMKFLASLDNFIEDIIRAEHMVNASKAYLQNIPPTCWFCKNLSKQLKLQRASADM